MSILRSRKSTIPILIFLVVFLLSGCTLLPTEEKFVEPPLVEPPRITYDTEEVVRGDIVKSISVTGSFESLSQQNTYLTDADGRIAEINVGVGDMVSEGDVMMTLVIDNLNYSIKMQEYSLEKTQLNYDRIKKIHDADGSMEFEFRNAEIDLAMAQLQLDNLKNTRDKSVLYAPISGEVIYMNPIVELGTYISPYIFLFTIADATNIQLQYSSTDSSMSSFKSGQTVEVEYDSIVYEGQVLSAASDPASGSTDKVLKVDVKGLPDTVRRGDTAHIKLIIDEVKNVLVIPLRAVKIYSGRKYVQILEDGVKKERDVETGLETSTKVEIVEGLEEGESVIMN
jgi:membrane fusion protein, macrolide-specific efflux system